MKSENILTLGIWILPVCLQVLIIVVMVSRGLATQFPCFLAYCLLTPTRDLTLLFIQNHRNLYAWIYWVGEGSLMVLQFAVLCEVVWRLVPTPMGFRFTADRLLKSALAFAALLALLVFAVVVSTGTESFESMLIIERCARVALATMLVITMAMLSHWGLTWRNYATGILIGSGIAGLQLVPTELRCGLHVISDSVYMWLKPLIYDCAVIAWAICFSVLSRVKSGTAGLPQADLTEWEGVLKGYLYRQ